MLLDCYAFGISLSLDSLDKVCYNGICSDRVAFCLSIFYNNKKFHSHKECYHVIDTIIEKKVDQTSIN